MTPRNEDNFLVEVPPEVYSEMMKHLSEEEQYEVEMHYSPYWKQRKSSPTKKEVESNE